MKNIILYVVSLVFIANTLIASAGAMPCMQQLVSNVIHADMLSEPDMPCHDEQKNNNKEHNKEHCIDACFCLISSASQTPYFEPGNLSSLNIHQQRFIFIDEHAVSKYSSALYRPPIYIS